MPQPISRRATIKASSKNIACKSLNTLNAIANAVGAAGTGYTAYTAVGRDIYAIGDNWYWYPVITVGTELAASVVANIMRYRHQDIQWYRQYQAGMGELRRTLGTISFSKSIVRYALSDAIIDCDQKSQNPDFTREMVLGIGFSAGAIQLIGNSLRYVLREKKLLNKKISKKIDILFESLFYGVASAGAINYLLELIYEGCPAPGNVLFPSQAITGSLAFILNVHGRVINEQHEQHEGLLIASEDPPEQSLVNKIITFVHELDLPGWLKYDCFLVALLFDIIVSEQQANGNPDPTDISTVAINAVVISTLIYTLMSIGTKTAANYYCQEDTAIDQNAITHEPAVNDQTPPSPGSQEDNESTIISFEDKKNYGTGSVQVSQLGIFSSNSNKTVDAHPESKPASVDTLTRTV